MSKDKSLKDNKGENSFQKQPLCDEMSTRESVQDQGEVNSLEKPNVTSTLRNDLCFTPSDSDHTLPKTHEGFDNKKNYHGGGTSDEQKREKDTIQLHKLFKRYAIRNSFFLWVIGFINNFHYCLVISAANALAEGYGFKNLTALITWANVFFGIVSRVVNMFIVTRASFNIRITAMALLTLFGLFFVSFSNQMGHGDNASAFVVMLIGVILSGSSSNYGESVVLTFVQRYPATMVGAWSSGTGISGVAASLLFIAFTSGAHLTQQQTFLVTTPLVLVYWLSFTLGMVSPQKILLVRLHNGKTKKLVIRCLEEEEEAHIAKLRQVWSQKAEVESVAEDYVIDMMMNIRGLAFYRSPDPHKLQKENNDNVGSNGLTNLDELNEDCDRAETPEDDRCCCSYNNAFRRYWRDNKGHLKLMHNTMWWFFFNLAAVYIAEYAAQLMAPYSFYCRPEWKSNFWVQNSYTISQFCYQFGVLISRSSLLLVQIKYVGVISIIQILNAICWVLQSKYMYIRSTESESRQVGLSFILFVWMIFIGLMGGASYVNVFYLILKRSTSMQHAEEKTVIREHLEEKGLSAPALEIQVDESKKKRRFWQRKKTVERESTQENELAESPASDDDVHVNHQQGSTVNEEVKPLDSQNNTTGMLEESFTIPVTAAEEGEKLNEKKHKKNSLKHQEEEKNKVIRTVLEQYRMENKLTDEEVEEILLLQKHVCDIWKTRREIGMNIGAMYATVGITLGNLVDLIFTNTMLKHSESC